MLRFITLFAFLITAISTFSQEDLSYFLPGDVRYDEKIPTPEQFFGQKTGEWHLTHDQILNYMKEIAGVSARAVLEEYARSYENRPLVHLIFTSEENQKKLDELKELHVKHANPNEDIPETNVPLVINLGYSVHGNESSGANSSVLTAYYLAAAQGEKIDKLLNSCIILVDPCLNPDGLTRHSTWANMHQSETGVANSDARQFNEVWPGGRTNHYWFDLNRDYILLVNPESQGRVAKYHEWLPNIVTDHHEMGANSTFFFQPGVPTRNNPLTPEKNYTLTREIAGYHARYLDKIGVQYFSEEQFDDYYIGKGSSYPDINGGVGILFEQAGFRGRIRETGNGIRKLTFGIRNQFTVTLSTLAAAMDLKDELLAYHKEFYRDALREAEHDPVKAYIFGNENDRVKSLELAKLLQKHQIEVYNNAAEVEADGKVFKPGTSYIVPVKQRQYRLIKALFEEVNTFTDSTFYDVSTWTFPYTFNVDFAKTGSLKNVKTGGIVNNRNVEGNVIGGKSALGYLFKWNEYTAPKALFQLQAAGLTGKVAGKNFSFEIDNQTIDFSYGTVLIPVNDQPLTEDQIFRLIAQVAKETGIDFYGLKTGWSPKGIDWGSNNFQNVSKPEVLLMVGGSTRSSEAGEIWHLFDQRYRIPLTLAETGDLKNIDLNRYNTIILPDGRYTEWGSNEIQKIKTWVQNKGVLLVCEGAAEWAAKNDLGKTRFKKPEKTDSLHYVRYSDREKETSLNTVSGAIFRTTLDLSHPLCYGYTSSELPVFKSGTSVAEPLGTKYSEPVHFSEEPFISGFISDKNLERLKGTPVVSVQNLGRGKIISYHESMTFRGIWLGTHKLFVNGVFFGNTIR